MRLIKDYQCYGNVPTDSEIKEGIEIANKEDCIVRIFWEFPYSGKYSISITEGMSLEECKEQLPKCYPV